MKVIVENSKISTILNSNEDISDYDISKIRVLPNNLEYLVPIQQTRVFPRGNPSIVVSDRYTLMPGDPDPMYNLSNFNLNVCKQIMGATISYEVEQFINNKPDGDTRYTKSKQASFTDILMYCKDWLSDNPGASEAEKAPYLTKIELINSAREWIRVVLSYYYSKIEEIRELGDLTITGFSWDFSQFETSDPDVWLETVRII